MKQRFKTLSFIVTLAIFVFMMIASNRDFPTGDGQKKVIVDLTPNYLGLCNSFFEGEKPLEVTIVVDKYTGTGSFEANFKTYKRYVNNNDGSYQYEANYKFEDIVVPKTGSYAITVTVEGETCFSCCTGDSCSGNKGRPFFRGLSTIIGDTGSSAYHVIIPVQANCF